MSATTLKSALGCVVFAAGMLVVAVGGVTFDCDNFNPDICSMDAIMFCLTNGSIIIGRCHAQRAVCLENRVLDETFSACPKSIKFDCPTYLANPFVCTRDHIPYCLNNGTVIQGSCAAKQAFCREGKQVVDDFSTCNNPADPNSANTGTDTHNPADPNSASTVTATVSIVLGLLLSRAF